MIKSSAGVGTMSPPSATDKDGGRLRSAGGILKNPDKADKGKEKKNTESKKQGTLDGVMKKVTFDEEGEKFKKLKNKVMQDLAKIRQEKVEIEKVKLEVNAREIEMMERLERMEKQLEELAEKEKVREAWLVALEEKYASWAAEGDTDPNWDAASGSACGSASGVSCRSGASRKTTTSVAFSSVSAAGSLCLSEKEVAGMKRLLYDQDRKSRQENIVIKGAIMPDVGRENVKEWAQQFVKNRLGLEVQIVNARISGKVIVARIASVTEKNLIMKYKSKLAGTNYYIEYDLSFEDRKVQEEINRWVKTMREKGLGVKTGSRRVLVNNVWIYWDDKQKIEEMVKQAEKQKMEPNSVRPGSSRETNEAVLA